MAGLFCRPINRITTNKSDPTNMNVKASLAAGLICAGLFSQNAEATIVKLETNIGDLYINLYDETTPETVANFLAYVNDGRYDNTFIHRSVPGFVIQGGGYGYTSGTSFDHIETFASVNNEPKLSNVRATISMAKVAGQPNSATSEFFINLVDNNASGSTNLDAAEQGYSVFGELTDESMVLVDQIAGYTAFNFSNVYNSGAFASLPLRDYVVSDFSDGIMPDENNFIIIHTATVDDAATDTASGLNPPANPNFNNNSGGDNSGGDNNSGGDSSSGGGGSMGVAAMLMLGLAGLRRRKL